jgi:3-hydroxyisobutyrate dehydrogenase-like beta-hydroxyacid dehydrogenase
MTNEMGEFAVAQQVAFLGLGAMGLPMALNLHKKGFAVTGWNRTPGRGAALEAAGGRLAPTVAEAVTGADFIVSMLTDPAAVEAVAHAFLPNTKTGALWLECSTIGPAAAGHMADVARRHGLRFVDAPVLGSVKPATDGELIFLAGGTPGDVEAARPLMAAMGRGINHMGEAGSGAAAKIISNMVTATLLTAASEGLALGERLGLDRNQLGAVLMEGPAGGPIVKGKMPFILQDAFAPAFQLKLMEKDLALALTEANRVGAALPAAAGAHGVYAGARAAGLGDQDFAAIAKFVREMARGPLAK